MVFSILHFTFIMKYIIFLLFTTCFSFNATGQVYDSTNTYTNIRDSVYLWSGEKHFFKKGDFVSFAEDNLKYPLSAHQNKIEGRVIVEFIIEKDGTVSNIKTVKGIGFGCDEEVERIIGLTSGLWSPGKHNGEPIRLRMMQPVLFKLPEVKKRKS